MLFLIMIGALLGLAIGGPLGMLVGGVLGWGAGRRVRLVLGKARVQAQSRFLNSTFSVMGCLCQSDGQVSKDERDIAERRALEALQRLLAVLVYPVS
jgi:DnaJ like chaperone protein